MPSWMERADMDIRKVNCFLHLLTLVRIWIPVKAALVFQVLFVRIVLRERG